MNDATADIEQDALWRVTVWLIIWYIKIKKLTKMI